MLNEFQIEFQRLKKVTDEHPDDGMAWLALGDFMRDESDNPNLVLKAYIRAQELLPNKDLRIDLGRAYAQNGEVEKGIAFVLASANERPRSEAYCILSDIYNQYDRFSEAEDAARIAIQLEPSFEEGYYLLGEAIKQRDPLAAIDAYRKAILLDDNYALAWQALGHQLSQMGHIEEGIHALTKAVALNSNDVWSRLFLAVALWEANRFAEADEQYRAALAIAPDFDDAQRWYKEFLDARQAENIQGS